ncbi:MAG: hypothetical protein WCH31_06035 [Actinomycetes bacterium]
MKGTVVAGALALVLAASAAGRSSDELTFFSNPGSSVVCRYSSFSGFQELKCTDRRVRGTDGGALTLRLHRSERAAELIFDSNPIEKKGAPVRRFVRSGFTCTLTPAQVRCSNATKHGFVLKTPKQSLF